VYTTIYSVHVHTTIYSVHVHTTIYSVHVYTTIYSVHVHTTIYSVHVHTTIYSVHVHTTIYSVDVYTTIYSVHVHTTNYSLQLNHIKVLIFASSEKNMYIKLDTCVTNECVIYMKKNWILYQSRWVIPSCSVKAVCCTTKHTFPVRFYERVFTEFRRGLVAMRQ